MKTRLEGGDMMMNRLGTSDLFITPIGFGAWAIGGSGWEFGWGEQNDKRPSRQFIARSRSGLTGIDTAAVYGMGHSEEVVAAALKTWSGPQPYVSRNAVCAGTSRICSSFPAGEVYPSECEDSLRRLKVDAIDLYQIHWPTEDLEEGWAAMAQLQKEGKVRWIGVSNFDVAEMRRADAIARIASLQPPYSLVRREVEPEILPYCRSNDIGTIVIRRWPPAC